MTTAPAADDVRTRLANVDADIRALLRALVQLGDTMVGLMNRRTALLLAQRDPRTERGRQDALEAQRADTERNQDLLGQRMDDVIGQLRELRHLEDALLRHMPGRRRPAPVRRAAPAIHQPMLPFDAAPRATETLRL